MVHKMRKKEDQYMVRIQFVDDRGFDDVDKFYFKSEAEAKAFAMKEIKDGEWTESGDPMQMLIGKKNKFGDFDKVESWSYLGEGDIEHWKKSEK